MDLATLNNIPRPITLGGVTYTVSALKIKEWAAVQQFLKDNVPNPLSVLRTSDLKGLSPSDRKELLSVALRDARNWPPGVASPEWWQALDHEGGWAKVFHCILVKHQAGFTAEQAEDLAEKLKLDEAFSLVFAGLGIDDAEAKAREALGLESASPKEAPPTGGETEGDSDPTP